MLLATQRIGHCKSRESMNSRGVFITFYFKGEVVDFSQTDFQENVMHEAVFSIAGLIAVSVPVFATGMVAGGLIASHVLKKRYYSEPRPISRETLRKALRAASAQIPIALANLRKTHGV